MSLFSSMVGNSVKNAVSAATGAAKGAASSTKSTGGSSGGSSGSGKTIADYQADYNAAKAAGDKAGMDAAHQGAEAIRAQQGYSGGADGSQKISLSGGTYKPNYASNYNGLNGNYQLTQEDINDLLSEAAANSGSFQTADEVGKQQLHERNREIYGQLGYDYDAQTGRWTPNAISSAIGQAATYNSAQKAAEAKYEEAMRAQQSAADAATEQAIAALEGQKYNVNKVGVAANQAAQDAYMQTLNPNGGLAESLASRGLLSSGLTESSQIAAGNAYQQALNQNATSVAEQLQEIERAIVDARRSGDISKAQALAQYAERVAESGMQAAAQIAGIQQWGWSQNQTDQQTAITNKLNVEQLELQRKQIEQELAAGKIDLQTAQVNLAWLDKLLSQQYQTGQAALEYQRLQNQYARAMGGF